MKAIFKLVFLTLATTTVLLACAKDSDNNAGYPGYPGYPGQPGYCQGGYCPQGYYQPTFYGRSQVINANAYRNFVYGQFCVGKSFFTLGYDTCKLVSAAPYIELRVPDLTLTNPSTQAQLVFNVVPKNNWSINGDYTPQEQVIVNLRKINNNGGFEGNFIDRTGGKGFGALVQIQGTGLPAAAGSTTPISVRVLYNNSEMLRANLVRVQ
jgi:hypothetical protein